MIRAAEHSAVPLLRAEMCDLTDWRALCGGVVSSRTLINSFLSHFGGEGLLARFLEGKESGSSTPCQVD